MFAPSRTNPTTSTSKSLDKDDKKKKVTTKLEQCIKNLSVFAILTILTLMLKKEIRDLKTYM